MIICREQKLTMLLPWKTASQTLRLRLHHINQSPYPEFFHFNKHLNRVVHQHITLADYLALPESHTGHDISVFVRNPYDRVFSGFLQILRDVSEQPRRKFDSAWAKNLVAEQLADNYRLLARAQLNFDEWFRLVPDYLILDTGRNSSLPLHPVHYWTHQGKQQIANHLGRVENFEADFKTLCRKYGISPANTESANRSPDNKSGQDPHGYRYAQRMNARTISKINTLFRDDFDLFGYEKIDA